MIFPTAERICSVCARLGSLLLTIVVVAGCAEDDGRSATVSGKVTLDGAPVPAGTVLLMSDDGHAASAELQADGNYQLQCRPGQFKVAVTPPPPADPMGGGGGEVSPSTVEIPQKYQDFGSSGLTTEVSEGNNTFDIALTP